MRWPLPAPRWSKMPVSSPSGGPPCRSALRLKGTPMIQREPTRLGGARGSVTVPVTSAMRMAVQLLKGAGHAGRAGRGGAEGAEDLPDLEERPARHLDRHQ